MKRNNYIILLFFVMSLLKLSAQEHKIGIVLSGGGALGYAHIGALQALEDYGIFPSAVSGASMGSIIGAFYANGFSPKQIREFIKFENFNNALKIISPALRRKKSGFSSQKNILNVFKKYIPHNSFDSLRYPLYVSVTNLSKGCVEYVYSGDNLYSYLLASAAIPVIFETVTINDMLYVDGGVLNNFPAQPLRSKCEFLIGIDVKSGREFTNTKRIKDIFMRTLDVVIEKNSVEGHNLCDVLIEPALNQKYDEFSFSSLDKIYKDGYTAVKKYLDEHPEIVAKLKQQ